MDFSSLDQWYKVFEDADCHSVRVGRPLFLEGMDFSSLDQWYKALEDADCPRSLVDQWYQALEDADCVRIMILLKKYPSLVKKGWKEEASRAGIGEPWMGRSVFHVAAMRGCVELIVRALKACMFEDMVPVEERTDCMKLFDRALGLYDFEANLRCFRELDGIPISSSARRGEVAVARKHQSSITRKDLFYMLCCKDGSYKVDALALAVLSYNPGVMDLLTYAIKTCEPSISWIGKRGPKELLPVNKANEENKSYLRNATKQYVEKLKSRNFDEISMILEMYLTHLDFNFIPCHEYLFHFLFTHAFRMDLLRDAWEHIKLFRPGLQRFLSEFRDGQGRAPIHVAADEGFMVDAAVNLFGSDFVALMAGDGNGKLAFHRSDRLSERVFRRDGGAQAPQCRDIKYKKSDDYSSRHKISVTVLSRLNGFRAGLYISDTISTAIIHDGPDILVDINTKPTKPRIRMKAGPWWKESYHQLLFPKYHKRQNNMWETLYQGDYFYPEHLLYSNDHSSPEVSDRYYEDHLPIHCVPVSYLQLACIVAKNPDIVCRLLSNGCHDIGMLTSRVSRYIHILAASGKYKFLKQVIDSGHCDPFIEDNNKNNALHYVLGEPIPRFRFHLLDYVSCAHLLAKDDREKGKVKPKVKKSFLNKDAVIVERKGFLNKDAVAERMGCVNLLLQAGCDVFKVNNARQGPYPQGCFGNNGEFLSWWYTAQTKEFAATQSNLTTAANAISITATLVATASYVGPLQPPMGYDATNHIQYENGWVATFAFCDTLSFYLAIAAIILSLIPSLPVPQQAMQDELRRTRRMVVLAVGVLFPSIICVLLAFASSSMAVISAKVLTSSVGGRLTIASIFVGAPSIVFAFFLFFIRLLGICFPRNSFIRGMYRLTSL